MSKELEAAQKIAITKMQLEDWYKQQYIQENNVKIANKIDDTAMKERAVEVLQRCEAAIDTLNDEIVQLEKE